MLSLLQLPDFKELCPESCQRLRDGKGVHMIVATRGQSTEGGPRKEVLKMRLGHLQPVYP